MSWLDIQTSLYNCQADNIGRPSSFREVLLTQFARLHEWYYQAYNPKRWITGEVNDLETLIEIRHLDRSDKKVYDSQKVALKALLQCYTPGGLLKTKKKGNVIELSRTGLMQLDFDAKSFIHYDLEEVKKAVFDLPYVAFCGLSCSGDGFYALVSIAEPDRLAEYAEHLFGVLEAYGIPADTTKGRNVQDLRYLSYDPNMLIRDEPEPLRIKRFKAKSASIKTGSTKQPSREFTSSDGLVRWGLKQIRNSQRGQRWDIVRKVAMTLGGTGDKSLLDHIVQEIKNNSEFSGQEAKYCECAEVCFQAGLGKPLPIKLQA